MSDEHNHEHHHDHENEHHHEHDHEHEHSHGPVENREQIVALLNYMCKHNETHEAELSKVIEKLGTLGEESAASDVKKAQEFFAKGNEALKAAYDKIAGK